MAIIDPESDASNPYLFAAIVFGIIFFPIFYLIWMFSSVRNFFLSWITLFVGLVCLSWLFN